ncbi:ATP-binding protein [Agromyces sp. NPDC049794]|uniref:ATP-binding protein n=1 Tax=unclassified Agromyces TaxID=2639701 RepID=UPI0033F85A55
MGERAGRRAADASRPGRWRRTGVRGRITLAAASVVALSLVLGAVGFHLVLRVALLEGLTTAAEQDAAALALQVEERGVDSLGELEELDDERLVQVIDASGAVIARSEDAPASPVARRGDSGTAVRADGETYVVAISDADGDRDADGDDGGNDDGEGDGDDGGSDDGEGDGGRLTVVVGRSTESVEETLATVAQLLAVSVPLLVALVALTAWLVVGRALAPVERMRRQVDAVTAASLAERLDEPPADDEIGRLAHTLNGMLGRLESAQAAQRRFISDASHELKSPLATLRQYAEITRVHPERVSQEELGEVVLEEGGRLEQLVQGMLVLARADEGVLRPEPVDIDLDDLLLEEAKRVRASGLEVDTSGVRATRVRGDAILLSQLVRNLVDNAAGHARSGIALAATPDERDGRASITVDDDGNGIPLADRERVFDRFVRLDAARARDTGGSGLGLAIVREIAHAHGGEVRVEDAPSGGARLHVELPVAASARLT